MAAAEEAVEQAALTRPWGLAWTLSSRGYARAALGDLDGAAADAQASRERFLALGDARAATWGTGLDAVVALRRGDGATARRLARQVRDVAEALGDGRTAAAAYDVLGALADGHDDAAVLRASAGDLRRRRGSPPPAGPRRDRLTQRPRPAAAAPGRCACSPAASNTTSSSTGGVAVGDQGVRAAGRELGALAGLDAQPSVVQVQHQATGQHVQPLVTRVRAQLGGRARRRRDRHLQHPPAAGLRRPGERPHGERAVALRRRPQDDVVGPLVGDQLVDRDAERAGQRYEVLQRQPPPAGLEPAQRRRRHPGASREPGHRQPAGLARPPQPCPDPRLDVVVLFWHESMLDRPEAVTLPAWTRRST